MNKLIVSVFATVALLAGGSVFAQSGDADSQAGSAWRTPQNYGPYTPPAPQAGFGPQPGTPAYYGNSGWTPPASAFGYGYVYRGTDAWGRPIYDAAPANQRHWGDRSAGRDRRDWRNRQAQRDRDGDGVPDRVDRYPNDPSRW